MPRLPQPGGDVGNWGTILNDYLSTAHNADGTLKSNSITESQLDPTVQSKLNSGGGTPGATGPIGPQGSAGPTGVTGAQGIPGATGTSGSQGATGPVGATGAQGSAGPAGATGSRGPTGTNGNDGAVGATGPIGPQGATGPTGTAGTSGATGATGAISSPGAAGIDGATGATGAQGATGPAGATTIAGISGLQAALDGKAASSHTHAQADIAGLTSTLAQVPIVIRHGSDAQYPRPSAVNPAFWFGSVTPQNLVDGDVYWETTTSSPPVFTGAFDGFASPHRAISLRRLLSAYTGPAIKVRRSSDNSEQDIGFTSAGDLDASALTTFAGSGSAYVTTWYDQSGNVRHFTQATSSAQPRIVNAGAVDTLNSKPCVVFDGVDDAMASSVIGLYAAGAASVAAVLAAAGNNATVLFSENNTTSNLYRMLRVGSASSTPAWSVQCNVNDTFAWSTDSGETVTFNNTQRQLFYADTGSTISTWRDGTILHNAVAATRGSAPNLARTSLGAHVATTSSAFSTSRIQELVAWPSDQTASRSSIQTAQSSFWGTP